MNCSKCKEEPVRALIVPSEEPPPAHGQSDQRGVRIFRFCKNHWNELQQLLPAV